MRAALVCCFAVIAAANHQHADRHAVKASSSSSPGNYQNYMGQYLPAGDSAYTKDSAGRGSTGMAQTSGGGVADYNSWTKKYGGKLADYDHYVQMYSSMAGGSPTNGGSTKGKENTQLDAFNKSMTETFAAYIPGNYANYASAATAARVNSGGNGAQAKSSSGTGLAASSGSGYQQYMSGYASQYLGGGNPGGSYVSQYMGGGGASGGYASYMQGYGGSAGQYMDYQKYMGQGASAGAGKSTQLAATKGGSQGGAQGGFDYQQYMSGGSSGGAYQKYIDQYTGAGNSPSQGFAQYMQGYAGAGSGAGSGAGYEKYMAQYTGGASGGYQKYMKQYTEPSKSSSGVVTPQVPSGDYKKFMQQGAAGPATLAATQQGHSAAAKPAESAAAPRSGGDERAAKEAELRKQRADADSRIEASVPKEYQKRAEGKVEADYEKRVSQLRKESGASQPSSSEVKKEKVAAKLQESSSEDAVRTAAHTKALAELQETQSGSTHPFVLLQLGACASLSFAFALWWLPALASFVSTRLQRQQVNHYDYLLA